MTRETLNTHTAVNDGHGGWKLRICKWNSAETSYCIADGSTDNMFGLSIDGTDKCFICNVCASLAEWNHVFEIVFRITEGELSLHELSMEDISQSQSRCFVFFNAGYPSRVMIEATSEDVSINGVHASNEHWRQAFLPLLANLGQQ